MSAVSCLTTNVHRRTAHRDWRSIPLLGNLFKRKGVSRNTNEILFFITPRISRPDYSATTQNNVGPRSTTIIQPVPLGNPPSNSGPVAPTTETQPVSFQAPGLTRPEVITVAPSK